MLKTAMKLIDSEVRDVISGENVTIVQPANIYACELRDNVFVGPFVEIQKGCVIGSGSRIQSHTFICENVTLGENCFIGHNVTFANDLFRSGAPDPSPDNWITISWGIRLLWAAALPFYQHIYAVAPLLVRVQLW